MMIRKATTEDILFIVNAMYEIERTADSNTFNNLFGCTEEETKEYFYAFLKDEENIGTEFSLNTYYIAEIDGERAGCCCLFFTDNEYYQTKSEIFPIHLKPQHLDHFLKIALELPSTREFLTEKYFLEYLYVDDKFRGMGLAKKIINYFLAKTDVLVLIPLTENAHAVELYKRMGFQIDEKVNVFPIENKGQNIYPSSEKIMLFKKNPEN